VRIRLDGGLPFVAATIQFGDNTLDIDLVLVDTGSAGSVFSADALMPLGFEPRPTDIIRQIRGVGGSEFVYSRKVEELAVGELAVQDFEIQVGAMFYGFPINGIIGTDFLVATRTVVDLANLVLHPAPY
jgi:hypothetical protein